MSVGFRGAVDGIGRITERIYSLDLSIVPVYIKARMNSPSSLKLLAIRSLLKDEALAISALKTLPMELFPPLFQGAFDGKQTNILRAMVAAWPFRCLPVGALMKTPELEILKAVLDGLDLLIKQKDRPRSCKLEVLDLRDAQHNFWSVWAGSEHGGCSPDVVSESQPVVSLHTQHGKQAVTVMMNLSLKSRYLCKSLKYFHWWAKQRKDVLQVICEKLEFGALPVYKPLKLLEVFEPSSIQELEVNARWDLKTLAMFAPGLGQMRNLQKLLVNEIFTPVEWITNREMREWSFREIISQFFQLNKLQHLYLNGFFFLNKRLDQVLRYLESPLQTLAITNCTLSESDMRYLSQCPSVLQLTYLEISSVTFSDLSQALLGRLLKKLTATLRTLKLKGCMLTDYQLGDFLPALSQCSQLVEVNFVRNLLIISSLKKLLQHTANLKKLTLEMYPAPVEVYDDNVDVLPQRFAQHCSGLLETLRGIREPNKVYFFSNRCRRCREFCVYEQDVSLCSLYSCIHLYLAATEEELTASRPLREGRPEYDGATGGNARGSFVCLPGGLVVRIRRSHRCGPRWTGYGQRAAATPSPRSPAAAPALPGGAAASACSGQPPCLPVRGPDGQLHCL
ncbi:PRAME family member 12-like [Mesocricetus auratus]|uniref:PRAME family member 12-like n=1 Tax=Mesocricetus auratus TaxID=10036 RepID=A0ABM2WJ36_MESAU|nr:PRAME family member 12-like [Mesocricetus auratus]